MDIKASGKISTTASENALTKFREIFFYSSAM